LKKKIFIGGTVRAVRIPLLEFENVPALRTLLAGLSMVVNAFGGREEKQVTACGGKC